MEERVPTVVDNQVLVTKYGYDKAGNRISVTDPRGDYFTTELAFDAKNRIVSQIGRAHV